MVRGLGLFKQKFAPFSDSYVLIGGAACDLLMEEAGLEFRATKDLDIVLCVEVLSREFADEFMKFVEEGGYDNRQRGDGERQFYRFSKPASNDYPFMLELFSRTPENIQIAPDSHLTPIPVEETINSLSAILLDEDYYECIQRGRREVNEVPILGVEFIIPFKMRAWIDLTQRKAKGERVDSRDIKKHRGDVFRLYALLSPEQKVELTPAIQEDVRAFIEAMPKEGGLNISDFGIRRQPLDGVLAIFRNIYGLE